MPIFYNEDIFDSALDYEVGGFETEKTVNITYADIYNNFIDSIEHKVNEYIETAIKSYAIQGYENPSQQAIDALGLIVEESLKIELQYYGKEYIVKSIANSNQAEKWLEKIKEKVQKAENNTIAEEYGIRNILNPESDLYKEASIIMEDSCIETLLESLSTIEL
jgi:hypothetical protein